MDIISIIGARSNFMRVTSVSKEIRKVFDRIFNTYLHTGQQPKIHNRRRKTYELYNLTNDPKELNNVIKEYPNIVKEFSK